MSDLVLSIRLTADGKGLAGEVRGSAEELRKLGQAAQQSNDKTRSAAEQFTASLKRQADTLGMTRSQTLAYEAAQHDLTAAQRQGVTESIRAIDTYDRKQQMLNRVRLAAASAGAIIAAILIRSLKDSVVQAAESEQAHLKLEAVLRATGNAAGWTKTQLDAQAESMKSRTGLDDDQVRNSMAVMLTFKQVQGQTFSQAMTMAADLSRLLGQDLQSSVLMLGKVMEDPEGGLLALRRAGVSFTDTAKDMIKEMVATGRQAEALEMILSTMRAQGIDRIAESMNQGLTKATRDAGQSWDDLLKAIGQTAVVKVPVEAALGSWAAYLKDMKNVIESGNWLERLAFFSVGYSSQRVVDMRNPPPPQVSQESPGSVALGRQEAMREHTMAQAMGAVPREGASWDALQKFWKEQEAAVARADEQRKRFIETLQSEAATLGMTTEQASIYKAEQLGIAGAQLEAVQAAAGRIAAYREEQENLKALSAQAAAERRAQEQGEEAARRKAEQETKLMFERVQRLEFENLTELEQLTRHLDEKSKLLNDAYAKKLIDEETFEQQSFLILAKYARAKTDIEEQEARRRWNQARGFFSNLAGMMESQHKTAFKIGKAAAIAGTIMDTYQAAMAAFKALAGIPIVGPALGAAAAAAAIVTGMAQVQKIRGTEIGDGGASPVFSANPSTGVPTAPIGGQEFAPPSAATQPASVASPQRIQLTIVGESFTSQQIADLIKQINELQTFGHTIDLYPDRSRGVI